MIMACPRRPDAGDLPDFRPGSTTFRPPATMWPVWLDAEAKKNAILREEDVSCRVGKPGTGKIGRARFVCAEKGVYRRTRHPFAPRRTQVRHRPGRGKAQQTCRLRNLLFVAIGQAGNRRALMDPIPETS
jgi:hypothetical protein